MQTICKMAIEGGRYKEVIDSLAALVPEVRLHVSKDGIFTRAVDTANVAMIDLNLPPGIFSSFTYSGPQNETLIGLDIEKIKKGFSPMVKKGDLVFLTIEDRAKMPEPEPETITETPANLPANIPVQIFPGNESPETPEIKPITMMPAEVPADKVPHPCDLCDGDTCDPCDPYSDQEYDPEPVKAKEPETVSSLIWIVAEVSGSRLEFMGLDSNTIRRDPNPPAINLPVSVKVSGADLSGAIKDMKKITDKMAIMWESGSFVVAGEGDTTKFRKPIPFEPVSVPENGSTVRSLFSLDYLHDMTRTFKKTDSIKVSFGEDHPLRLTKEVSQVPGTEAVYLLAPRIEAD